MLHVDDDHRRRLLVDRHLLGPSGRDGRSIGTAVDTLSLLHSTDPSTPYLSLHARTDATVADISRAYDETRTLLRHTTIRRTVFTMPLDVVPDAHGAYNGELVARLRRQLRAWIDDSRDTEEPADPFLERTEADVLQTLADRGPLTGAQLADAVPGLRLQFDAPAGRGTTRPMRITSKVLEVLAAEGRIGRARPTGESFTSGAWTWAPIEAWLGVDGIAEVEPAVALDRLLARHLAIAGPATVTDLAWFTGLAKGRVRASLDRLDVQAVRLTEVAEDGYVLAGDALDADRIDGVVALLPGLDATTMAWKQRGWYVADEAAEGWFDRNGNAGPTVWLDGRVVGAWTQRADGEVVTDVADPGVERLVAAEVERLVAWLGEVRVRWRYPTPRTKRLDAAPTAR